MAQSSATAGDDCGQDGELPPRRQHPGDHRRRPRRGARLRRARPRGAARPGRRSGTTRTPRSRRRRSSVIDGVTLLDPRRLRRGRGRRHGHAARPRLGLHQHRRREGLPRGGRGGPQAAPDRGRRRGRGRARRAASARPSPPSSRPSPGAAVDEAELIAHVKGHLALFKAPKQVLPIDTIGRAPNGKVDYKRMKGYAADQLGVRSRVSPVPRGPPTAHPRPTHGRPGLTRG